MKKKSIPFLTTLPVHHLDDLTITTRTTILQFDPFESPRGVEQIASLFMEGPPSIIPAISNVHNTNNQNQTLTNKYITPYVLSSDLPAYGALRFAGYHGEDLIEEEDVQDPATGQIVKVNTVTSRPKYVAEIPEEGKLFLPIGRNMITRGQEETIYTYNSLSSVDLTVEQKLFLVREIQGVTKYLEETNPTAKSENRRISQVKPNVITQARKQALSDLRLIYIQACLVDGFSGHLSAYCKFNADCTTIEVKCTGESSLVCVVRNKDESNLPAVASNITNDMSIFIKWAHMCNAAGDAAPLVVIANIENMPEDAYFMRKTRGLSNVSDKSADGYLFLCKTRVHCGKECSWIFIFQL